MLECCGVYLLSDSGVRGVSEDVVDSLASHAPEPLVTRAFSSLKIASPAIATVLVFYTSTMD